MYRKKSDVVKHEYLIRQVAYDNLFLPVLDQAWKRCANLGNMFVVLQYTGCMSAGGWEEREGVREGGRKEREGGKKGREERKGGRKEREGGREGGREGRRMCSIHLPRNGTSF